MMEGPHENDAAVGVAEAGVCELVEQHPGGTPATISCHSRVNQMHGACEQRLARARVWLRDGMPTEGLGQGPCRNARPRCCTLRQDSVPGFIARRLASLALQQRKGVPPPVFHRRDVVLHAHTALTGETSAAGHAVRSVDEPCPPRGGGGGGGVNKSRVLSSMSARGHLQPGGCVLGYAGDAGAFGRRIDRRRAQNQRHAGQLSTS